MSGPLRILVTGGRDCEDRDLVWRALTEVFRACGMPHAFLVIQGGASGADQLARAWCFVNAVRCDNYPADWRTHGRAAGPIRNGRMIAEGKPDLVLAFPGGRGTADCVRQARAAGVPVRVIDP